MEFATLQIKARLGRAGFDLGSQVRDAIMNVTVSQGGRGANRGDDQRKPK
jgi:hypothetical protein